MEVFSVAGAVLVIDDGLPCWDAVSITMSAGLLGAVMAQRGREVWSMKTQYLSEEVMIPGSSLLLSFDAVIGRMVLEQADGDSPEP